jgi:hypothetical protein
MGDRVRLRVEGERLVLEKRSAAYLMEAVLTALVVLVMLAGVGAGWVFGRHQFDPIVRLLYPLLFLVSLFLAPRSLRKWKIVLRGQTFVFDRAAGRVEENGRAVASINEVKSVAAEVESNPDGADSFRARLILRDGRKILLEESFSAADVNEVALKTSEFLELPLDGYHGLTTGRS